MLTLYKLQIFSLVAQTGSFSRAAKRLYLTQSAISQHVAGLEKQLGTQLFERGPTGVRLTQAGENLLHYAQQILRLAAEAEIAVTQVENLSEGQLKLGATPVASIYLLPTWIQKFHSQYPALNTSLHTGITDDIVHRVVHSQLDLGFVEGELKRNDNFHSLEVREITLYLVVSREHPWSQREEIRLQELEQARFIMRPHNSHTRAWAEKIFRQHHVEPQIVAEFSDPEVIKQAVISGMGVTILPLCMVQKECAQQVLSAVPIREITLKRSLKLIWKADTVFTPISRAFLATLVDSLPVLVSLLQQTRPSYPLAEAVSV
jgi:DNA-binding transcriptional LysR family regulator